MMITTNRTEAMIRAIRSNLSAKTGAILLTIMPMITGTVVIRNTPKIVRPTDRLGASAASMKCVMEKPTINGRVTTASRLMIAVKETESAVSPRAR